MRRIVLRILLWSLALAAVAGVLAVLLAMRQVMLRVTMTGFATTGAAALLLPLTFMLDRMRLRPAGLFAMVLVVAVFLVTTAWIWLEPILGWQYSESLGWTVGALGTTGVLAFGCLLARLSAGGEACAWTGIGVCAVTLVLWVVSAWVGFGTSLDVHLGVTGAVLLLYGCLAVMALAGLERITQRPWRWIGVACSAAAAALLVPEVWEFTWGSETMNERLFSILTSVAALVAYTNLALLMSLKPGQVWVRVVAIGSATATACLINIHVFTSGALDDSIITRFIAAGVIVTACATLALRVLAAINRRGEMPMQTAFARAVTLFCPRCNKKQTVPAEGGACAGCGLRISVRIEEPTCPSCGYLIYGGSDRCPECGTETRGADASSASLA